MSYERPIGNELPEELERLRRRVAELESAEEERSRTQDELRLLSAAVSQSTEGIAVVDLDGNLLYLNDALAAMHGYSRAELVGKHLSVLHTPEQMTAVKAANLQIRQTGSFSGELWNMRRDGTAFPTLMQNSLLRNDKGVPIGMLGAIRDISDRKKAEKAIRHTEYRLALALKAADIMFWDWNVLNGEAVVNERVFQLLGFEPEDADPTFSTWEDLLHPEDKPRVMTELSRHIEGVTPFFESEYRLRTKNGNWRWILARGDVIAREESGAALRMAGTFIDVTDRKAAEEALGEHERLLRSIISASPIGICLLREGTFAWANETLVGMFGFLSEQDILGQPPDILFPSEAEAKQAMESLCGQLKTGGNALLDAKLGTAGRVSFFGHIKARALDPLLPGKGTILTVSDITERRLAEEAIRGSEEKYRLLVDHAPIGIVSMDTEGRILEVNRKLVEILGSPSAEATKQVNVLAFPLLREAGVSNAVRRCTEEGRIVHAEFPYRSKWGRDMFLRLSLTPAEDANGRVTGCQAVIEDITERKAAEESLRQSEERYRILTQNSLTGIYIHQDGTFVYVNDRLAEMMGYSPEELIGRKFWEFVHPEDRALVRGRGLAKTLGRDVFPQYEFRVVCKTGEVKLFEILATNITYRGRAANMGNVADVTQRKRAEEALAKAQALLVAALEQNPAGILIADAPDGRIRFANPAALGIRGETDEILTEIPFELHPERWKTFHPDGTPFEANDLPLSRAVVHGETSRNVEAIIRRPDGEERWLLTNAAPVRNRSGQVIAGVVVFLDITDRKWAEQALLEMQENYRNLWEQSKRSEELYRSLLDSSPDAVVVYDMAGRALYVNASFTRIFGWTLEELKGKRIEFVPESERNLTMSHIHRLIHDGIRCTGFETKRLARDGRILDCSISATRYHDHEGNPHGMLVILSDITERKRLEDQLRQASKMEAIGQLAGGVAHDFNNLLTAIIGYANLVIEQMPRDDVCHERLVQISHAAERAAALTKQLLAFSRKQMLDVRVLDLNETVKDFEKILRRLIGEHIEVITRFDFTLGRVKADLGQIEQILMNLSVNARDAMRDGGRLTIETANVDLDPRYCLSHAEVSPGPYVMLAISDTGRGITTDVVHRIFDPFFTTKDKGVGTGLGLSTVYGIVKQHQGHIEVYSEPLCGTTFKVYLPRVDALPERRLHVTERRTCQEGGETILVVEDEDIVRALACEALEMLGYAVLKASDPGEAIAVCTEYQAPIHLLLTDVVLPQMDGRSLYRRLSPLHPETRVLYVSGYTEDFIVRHGVLDRGVQFLQKPFTVKGLGAKVREILDASGPFEE